MINTWKQISRDVIINMDHVFNIELWGSAIKYYYDNDSCFVENFHCSVCAEKRFKRYIEDGKSFEKECEKGVLP